MITGIANGHWECASREKSDCILEVAMSCETSSGCHGMAFFDFISLFCMMPYDRDTYMWDYTSREK